MQAALLQYLESVSDSIDLSSFEFGDEDIQGIIEKINLDNLRSLTLKCHSQRHARLSLVGAVKLLGALSAAKQLQSLNLSNNRLNSALITAIAAISSLEHLIIDDVELGGGLLPLQSLSKLKRIDCQRIEGLSQNDRLALIRHVHSNRSRAEPSWAERLKDVDRETTSLDLRDFLTSDDTLDELLAILPEFKHLSRLDLRGAVGSDGFPNCGYDRIIGFVNPVAQGCITLDGVRRLVAVLQTIPDIVELCLDGNPIGQQGLEQVLRLAHLLRLEVSSCDIASIHPVFFHQGLVDVMFMYNRGSCISEYCQISQVLEDHLSANRARTDVQFQQFQQAQQVQNRLLSLIEGKEAWDEERALKLLREHLGVNARIVESEYAPSWVPQDTLLISAVYANCVHGAKFLLDHGADIEAHDGRQYTATFIAAEEGFPDMVALLLSRGASLRGEFHFNNETVPSIARFKMRGGSERHAKVVGVIERFLEQGVDLRELQQQHCPAVLVQHERPWTGQPCFKLTQPGLDRAINQTLASGSTSLAEKPRCFIPEFRGLHYYSTFFDTDSRSRHLRISTLNRHTPSSAVFAMTHAPLGEPAALRETEVEAASDTIRQEFQRLTESGSVQYRGRAYANKSDALQEHMSNEYRGYQQSICGDSSDDDLRRLAELDITRYPHCATSDLPLHALRYAAGLKKVEGLYEHRLPPRYDQSGKPAVRYVGKIYIALMDVETYFRQWPRHLVSMQADQRVSIRDSIIWERETSYPGRLDSGCLFYEAPIEWPDFSAPTMPDHYQDDFGIDERTYQQFKQALSQGDEAALARASETLMETVIIPHCSERLLNMARAEAKRREGVLVFRSGDRSVSLTLPGVRTLRGVQPLSRQEAALFAPPPPSSAASAPSVLGARGADDAELDPRQAARRN